MSRKFFLPFFALAILLLSGGAHADTAAGCYGADGKTTCQYRLKGYTRAVDVNTSMGLRFDHDTKDVFLFNYPDKISPLFLSNTGDADLFIPQATEAEATAFLKAVASGSLKGLAVDAAIPSSSFTATPAISCGPGDNVTPESIPNVPLPFEQNSGKDATPIVLEGYTKMTAAQAKNASSFTISVGSFSADSPLIFRHTNSDGDEFIEFQKATFKAVDLTLVEKESIETQIAALQREILILQAQGTVYYTRFGKYPETIAAQMKEKKAEIARLNAQLSDINERLNDKNNFIFKTFAWDTENYSQKAKLYKITTDRRGDGGEVYTEVDTCKVGGGGGGGGGGGTPPVSINCCGSDDGKTYTDPPNAELCKPGCWLSTPVEKYYNNRGWGFNWRCKLDTDTSFCSSERNDYTGAVCGSSNGRPALASNAPRNLCARGTATTPTLKEWNLNSGLATQWKWACQNSFEGHDYQANCKSDINLP